MKDLIEKFVCVRMVKANGMDLSRFQFDYDLTFAAFFLNADGTIYGRYGSRSSMQEAAKDISLEGFRAALDGAIALHTAYPGNKSSLAAKRGPAPQFGVPEEFPLLRERFTSSLDYKGAVARSCIHCHQVGEAQRQLHRANRRPVPQELIYAWPMPDVLGLVFDPKQKATVRKVVAGSRADKDGFQAHDKLLTLAGQPLLSIADVQWVLHSSKTPAQLEAEVLRDGRPLELTLSLDQGWWTKSDISWRPTAWGFRRMATGGLVLEDLADAQRRSRQLAGDILALQVKRVGQYGASAVGKKAGFREGDVIVRFDGQTNRMSEAGLMAYALQHRMPGSRVVVTVLRDGRRLDLRLLMQE